MSFSLCVSFLEFDISSDCYMKNMPQSWPSISNERRNKERKKKDGEEFNLSFLDLPMSSTVFDFM